MKIYCGWRTDANEAIVTVNGAPLSAEPSRAIRDHSPTGFEWGYPGSGPSQLALAILLDVTGDPEVAEANYHDFKRAFVVQWEDEWRLTEAEVREWLSLSQTRAE